MIRVVLDTNIIISSIFWRGKPYKVMKKGILGEYQLVISKPIIDELTEKLRNKFNFPKDKTKELVNILHTHCELVDVKSKFNIVRDKKDNKIIECAFDGNAEYLVTGDKDLLILEEFKGIKIMNTSEFLSKKSNYL